MHERTLEDLAARSEWVRSLARNLIADSATTEDIAQEASLAAIVHRGAIRDSEAWWKAVTHKLVANFHRRDVRHRRRERDGARPDFVEDTAESVIQIEQQRLLAAAVLALDEVFRNVVVMRFYDGLERREIAGRLDLPIATVNSRLTRAMAKLRERLEKEYGSDRGWMVVLAPLAASARPAEFLAVGVFLTQPMFLAVAALITISLGLGLWASASTLWGGASPNPVAIPSASVTVDEEDTPAAGSPARQVVEQDPQTREVDPSKLHGIVVDLEGKPVPGAVVRRLDKASDPLRVGQSRFTPSHDNDLDLFLARGPRVPLDRKARFAIAKEQHHAAWSASFGDLRGVLTISFVGRRPATENRIVLHPLEEVRVKVVDATGQAVAGIPVVVFEHEGQAIDTVCSRLVLTGADGRATIEWCPALMRNPLARARIGLAMIGGDQVYRSLSDVKAGETVVLRAPHTGSVSFDILINGKPIEDRTVVSLRSGRQSISGIGMRLTQAGSVHFAHVELDQHVYVSFDEVSSASVEGPTESGQMVKSHLRLVRHQAKGRIVHDRSSDIRQAWLEIEIAGVKVPIRKTLPLDVDGAFSVPILVAVGVEFEGAEAKIGLIDSRESIRTRVHVLSREIIDLGELRFGTDATVLKGIVLDADQLPLSGQKVQIVRGGTGSWHHTGTTTQSDASGRFRIPRPSEPGLHLTVLATDQLRHEPQPIDDQNRLIMISAASLHGRIDLGTSLDDRHLHLGIWDQSQGPAPASFGGMGPFSAARGEVVKSWCHFSVDSGGVFAIRNLKTGSYTIAISDRAGNTIHRREDIRVKSGRAARPRALNPVDLKQAIRIYEFDIRGEHGQELDFTLDLPLGAIPIQGGRLVLSAEQEMAAFTISANGYLSKKVPAGTSPVRATLTRGLSVQLAVKGLEGVEGRLQVSVQPVKPDSLTKPYRTGLNARGKTVLRLGRPGEYRVSLGLSQSGGLIRWQSNLDAARIEVRQSGDVHNLHVDAETFLSQTR